MLSELSIEDFAIIDRLRVRFETGFTVLTGETGAGKSIIIDALQAALGARVSSDVVRSDARMAVVEAVFDAAELEDGELRTLLAENGIEEDDTLILRREISASGRGTARVNGRAVPLSLMAAAGARLVDIHGQSDHLSVLRRDTQRQLLDEYGGLIGLSEQVSVAAVDFRRMLVELEEMRAGQRAAEQQLDLLRFQSAEIVAAGLREGEEEELAAERNRLANAARLGELAESAYESLGGEAGASEALGHGCRALADLVDIDDRVVGLAEQLQAASYEVDDVAESIRRYRDEVEFDPQRLTDVEERLDLLMRLKRKYGATVEEVIAFGDEVKRGIEDIENWDERVAALKVRLDQAGARAGRLVWELSLGRRAAAERLGDAMSAALQGLGLGRAEFTVSVGQEESEDGLEVQTEGRRFAYGPSGIDEVRFLVSFNPGEPLRPLERVASGGETARFLLALKSVLAGADRTPTLVFDEVDVGVGGRHGMVVAERLRTLARSHQVLAITHLPQVAALAEHHLTVGKAVEAGRTTVAAQELATSERVQEIAHMMAGTASETARRSAEELLEAARDRHD